MIPGVAHFIWLGQDFPWVHALAIRSCAERGGFERVVLHCSSDLGRSRWWSEVARLPGFVAHRIDPEARFRAAPGDSEALLALYRRLRQPAARANMLRAAILATEGGVYLDMDTITLANLDHLRARAGVFFGQEHIVLPASVQQSRRPDVRLSALLRLSVRELCRRGQHGWRVFRRIERLYPVAPNNAVIGGEPGHPFLRDLLRRMVCMAPRRQLVRFALGTHLLQEAAAAAAGDPSVMPVAPHVFYPLAPEISEHWFRENGTRAAELLLPETRVVHWYASVRTRHIVPGLTPDRVCALAHRQPFSDVAARFVRSAAPRDAIDPRRCRR